MAKLAFLAVLAALIGAASCQSSTWSIYIAWGWGYLAPNPSQPSPSYPPPPPPTYTPPPPPNDLKVDYYAQSCYKAEKIVRKAVEDATAGVQAGLVRLFFHDCFVRGCDASVLLKQVLFPIKGERTEMQGFPNLSLRGFDVIDAAKEALEKECPGVVSCADIVAFAARDASNILSGNKIRNYSVPAGRLDGKLSLESDVFGKNLPPPFADLGMLTKMFADKYLNQTDMVVLSGAHSIGQAHCPSIDRIQPPKSPSPSMDSTLAAELNKTCDTPNNATTVVPQDSVTRDSLDSQYYENVLNGKVLFTSDATLASSDQTKRLVKFYAGRGLLFDFGLLFGPTAWYRHFEDAMVKMGNIDVMTGPPKADREIRKQCWKVNG